MRWETASVSNEPLVPLTDDGLWPLPLEEGAKEPAGPNALARNGTGWGPRAQTFEQAGNLPVQMASQVGQKQHVVSATIGSEQSCRICGPNSVQRPTVVKDPTGARARALSTMSPAQRCVHAARTNIEEEAETDLR
jgi:hypothetical protein